MAVQILTTMRKQTVVYWGTPATDGRGGYTYATAVELQGRWIDKTMLVKDPAGREVTSTTMVYLGQDVDPGGHLYYGTIASLGAQSGDNPRDILLARMIINRRRNPSFQATEDLYQSWL